MWLLIFLCSLLDIVVNGADWDSIYENERQAQEKGHGDEMEAIHELQG